MDLDYGKCNNFVPSMDFRDEKKTDEKENLKKAMNIIDDYIQKNLFKLDPDCYPNWYDVCQMLSV